MKPTKIVVTKGATTTGPEGKTWAKCEYSIEFEVETPTEAQVAKAEAEATIDAWLAAFTMAPPSGPGPEAAPSADINALAAAAFDQTTAMKDKPGRWMWSRRALELKGALLARGGKATVIIDGVTYDLKLGDSRDEANAFLSFWPRSG